MTSDLVASVGRLYRHCGQAESPLPVPATGLTHFRAAHYNLTLAPVIK